MFLLPRPRRDLPFVLAPMSRRLSPRETAPPRRRRRDQPRPTQQRAVQSGHHAATASVSVPCLIL